MNKQDTERVITEYLKPVFGFALKRCKNVQDAEDLSQDIILKAYRALISRDDIERPDKFIWTIAHNALSNYYRDASHQVMGIPIDNMEELLSEPCSCMDETDQKQIDRLQKEIAYLSKMQRRIVIAYYFENKRQKEIAAELGIPLGTVKWHLFEAKKELKRYEPLAIKHSHLSSKQKIGIVLKSYLPVYFAKRSLQNDEKAFAADTME